MKLTEEQRAGTGRLILEASTGIHGDAAEELALHLCNVLADLEEAEEKTEALEVVIKDHQRLVREMDVILCGEDGAAKQASLCDLVGYVKDQLAGATLFATRQQLARVQNAYAEAAYADWSKHESALVVQLRQQLAEARDLIAAGSEPIYQLHIHGGEWIDQKQHSYEYNLKHGHEVRIVYLAPQSAIEQAVAPYKRDAERIDWLERQFRTSTVYMNGEQPFRPNHKVMALQGSSFRAAIDAALSAKEKSNG